MNLKPNRNRIGKYSVAPEGWLLVILLVSCLFPLPGSVHAEEIVKVKSIDYLSTPKNISIAVGLSSVGRVVHYRLSNPERIIVDLKSASLAENVSRDIAIKETDNPVKRIRTGRYKSNTVRIVCDLEKKDLDYKVSLLKKPLRLGISIFEEKAQQGYEKEKGPGAEPLPAEKTAGDLPYKASASDEKRSAEQRYNDRRRDQK